MMSFIGHQLLSFASALVVTLNLGFWMFPLIGLSIIRFIFGGITPIDKACARLLEFCYKTTAKINSLWMIHVVRVRVNVTGELPDHPAPIIVVNHQTWFDIPILHHVVTGSGPMLKFLIKRELVWVPIVGWICYALRFPRLNRTGTESDRRKDLAAIESASSTLTRENGAMLIFAEGTRFTQAKHKNQNSPYKHLLNPRPGGLKITLAGVTPDTPVLDITIDYKGGNTNFWSGLGGANRDIDVHIEQHTASEITDVRGWLDERWKEKDARLSRS